MFLLSLPSNTKESTNRLTVFQDVFFFDVFVLSGLTLIHSSKITFFLNENEV